MENAFNVVIAEAALWSLQDAESFKSNYIGSAQAAAWADGLLAASVKAISQDPVRYRHNAMLADKGISIRERLDVDDQYRCLYDVDEQNGVIEILLFVSTKQDLEKMLYRYFVLS